ncbi:MAG: hypothetical protein HYX75_14155 [Acidobacteria bacterium]|nr:hypothetical protein [Acidobacteriota bacterium]
MVICSVRRFALVLMSVLASGVHDLSAASWAHTVGAVGVTDTAADMELTADGGCILAGRTSGQGRDGLLVKISSRGKIQWQKSYRGRKDDSFDAVVQTSEGGFFAAGDTDTSSQGAEDFWCVKTGSSGKISWQRNYGGAAEDLVTDALQTSDGGYLVVGTTRSFGAGGRDAWCLRLDASGNIIWQKAIGGPADDSATSIAPAADGGYVIAGRLDKTLWVFKLDPAGALVWDFVYGTASVDLSAAIARTADGGFVVGSVAPPTGQLYPLGVWLLRLDAAGGVLWQKRFQEYSVVTSISPSVRSLVETADGSILISGAITVSTVGYYSSLAFYRRIDASGILLWQRSFSGARGLEAHSAESIRELTGGDLLVGGHTSAKGGPGDAMIFRVPGAGGYPGECDHFSVSAATIADHTAGALPASASVTATTAVAVAAKPRAHKSELKTRDLCTAQPLITADGLR